MKTNNEMEYLAKLCEKQPELFAQLPPSQKMAVGIYESAKASGEEKVLTPDEVSHLRQLKKAITEQNLTASERLSLSLKILQLEEK